MSLISRIQYLKGQIIDTENLLSMVIDHPLMSIGLVERIAALRKELREIPATSNEAKIQLLFSGNAVFGSQGVKSLFVSRIIAPFQAIIKTQAALVRFGNVGTRIRNRKKPITDLYLTSLPSGSFGIELSQVSSDDFFDAEDVSTAMKDVIHLIANSARNDEDFEESIIEVPKQNLVNLKKFLHYIQNEKSILKMESGEVEVELSVAEVSDAFQRVSSTIIEEEDIFVKGIFRGLLLDSSKFEIQNEDGKTILGFLNSELSESELIEYNKTLLNAECIIHLKTHRTSFKTGNEKVEYELLGIRSV